MFKKVLIANRGEIACRIMHTARRLGIHTVGIYSDVDMEAPHVNMADEAYLIGRASVAESYLRGDKIIDVAKKAGAEAIHPGYGFLSENAEFAKDCHLAGLTFIGPSVEAITIMGSKSASKQLMEKVGVPVTPGYHGEDQSYAYMLREAQRIGFPIIIKASGGGGGKGMRIVREAAQFEDAFTSAQREVTSSFKDSRILLEKYIEAPRHIEVQIFGDNQGNLVHLFERDCSLQRRYQKIVEEAPAPDLSQNTREKLYEAALQAAQAVHYIGAGTVEFLMDKNQNFYFMEMNTRLQVEHPVTEMITNLDLVEWQLRVACGDPLPLSQAQINRHGHSIEVRLCAENPAKEFLPTTGILTSFKIPKSIGNVRFETGVAQGIELSVHYDPMISKVVAWGESRSQAINRLHKALSGLKISGVHTNKAYLEAILKHSAFQKAEVSTHFIETYHHSLLQNDKPSLTAILLAAIGLEFGEGGMGKEKLFQAAFWRMNTPYRKVVHFLYGQETHTISLELLGEQLALEYLGKQLGARLIRGEDVDFVELLDERIPLLVQIDARHISVTYHGETFTFDRAILQGGGETETHQGDLITAPMPGKVIAVKVKAGAKVSLGDPVLVLEAMKMEHTLKAPLTGVVDSLSVAVGDLVEEGMELVTFTSGEEEVGEIGT